MIILANPIYDVVFKALLEDLEIAREFLSALLGLTILNVRLISQEHVRKDQETGDLLAMRLDFCAIVRTEDDRTIQVIIELQKAKIGTNPLRFRYYLANRYMSTEEVVQDGETQLQSLPIISVYLLGYTLDENLPMATSVKRGYYDAVTGKALENPKPNQFIEQLSHDANFVQIPKITGEMGTQLERVLSIFDQSRKLQEDEHRLEMDEKLVKTYPELTRIYRTLNRLQESPEMEKLMTLEDIFRLEQKEEAAEAKKQLAEQRAQLAAERKQLAAERKQLAAERKRREEAESRREEAESEIARLRKLLDEQGDADN